MFNDVHDNIVICINKDYIQNKILPLIQQKKCNVIDCSADWKAKQEKII